MRNPTGYLSQGPLYPWTDPDFQRPPGIPGGGLWGKGPGMGKGRLFVPHADVEECDTFTCAHCCTVVFVKPMCDPADFGGLCLRCTRPHKPAYVCPRCHSLGTCDPYEEKLKRWEARGNFLRDVAALR